MDERKIAIYLKQSLADTLLSKSEKRNLKEIINNSNLSKRQLDWLLSQVFDFAINTVRGLKQQQVLNWLEQVNKLLLPGTENLSINHVYFSPGNACLNAINNQIDAATHSICVCVFTISDNRIRDRLLYAHQRGVSIKIITDDDKCNDKGSDIETLYRAGVKIKVDHSRYHMHHKYAIFDGKIIITGSYNWTRSAADHNQENIVLSSEPAIVTQFIQTFNELWDQMVVYK